MAYSWGFEDFDWSVESGQDIPKELEKLVINAVEELFHNVPATSDVDRVRSSLEIPLLDFGICDTVRGVISDQLFRNTCGNLCGAIKQVR